MKACAALWPLLVIPCIVEKQRRIHKGMAVLLFDRIWYRALWIQNGAAPRPLSCGNVIKRQFGWSALSATTRIDPSPYTIKISWAEKPLRYFFVDPGRGPLSDSPTSASIFDCKASFFLCIVTSSSSSRSSLSGEATASYWLADISIDLSGF